MILGFKKSLLSWWQLAWFQQQHTSRNVETSRNGHQEHRRRWKENQRQKDLSVGPRQRHHLRKKLLKVRLAQAACSGESRIYLLWVHSFEMAFNFWISKNLEDCSSNFSNFWKALFQFRILLWKVRKTIFKCLYFWGKVRIAFAIDEFSDLTDSM